MSLKRGDIVDVLFPFSDSNQLKLRPALVVQSDSLASSIDVLVACITSNLSRSGPARVVLLLSDPAATSSRLKSDSVVLADKLATIDRRTIRSTRGVFPYMDLVDTALRTALSL